MSGPHLDMHEVFVAVMRDLEHQVLTEREALLAADMADEEQRDHERDVRERDADIQPFTMGAMQ